jgi:hypothetical protein
VIFLDVMTTESLPPSYHSFLSADADPDSMWVIKERDGLFDGEMNGRGGWSFV